jgi:GMP synthase (glutamine-hydrolysing)
MVWSQLAGADALMVGGAGAHTVTRSYRFSDLLEELVRTAIARGVPFFGSCFGHHLLVQALGGRVVTDHDSGEVGTFDVELTEAGRRDPLLAGIPSRFAVQLGHHDRVDRLPVGLVELAASERCRHQILRLIGQPVYSTQFHSEMNEHHLAARLEMYRHTYLADRTRDQEISVAVRPSPWAELLLGRFLELYARSR